MVSRIAVTVIVLGLLAGVIPANAGVPQQEPPPAAGARAVSVINLNTATAAQLETLPGIGVKTAARIVEHRQKTGGFKKIEELMNVKGIGEKSFLKLKPYITVAAPKPNAQ